VSYPQIKITSSSGRVYDAEVETGIVDLVDIEDLVAGQNVVFSSKGLLISASVKSVDIVSRDDLQFLRFITESAGDQDEIKPSVYIDKYTGIGFRLLDTDTEYWIDGFDPDAKKVILIKRTRDNWSEHDDY